MSICKYWTYYIAGTSTNTPTTVASVAPESSPNEDIATATASSKKFDAPIIPAGAATLYRIYGRGILSFYLQRFSLIYNSTYTVLTFMEYMVEEF